MLFKLINTTVKSNYTNISETKHSNLSVKTSNWLKQRWMSRLKWVLMEKQFWLFTFFSMFYFLIWFWPVTLHVMYIKVFEMDSAVSKENMLNWIHFYVIVRIFSLFHHLTSSFILDCEIVKASNADNKREICIFSSYKIHYWKKLLPHKSVLLCSEPT